MMKKSVCLLAVVCICIAWLPPVGAQQVQTRGVLLTDASPDETTLWVDMIGDVAVDQSIILESRDRTARATYRVLHVFDNHILLTGRLAEPWLAGSRVLQ